MINPYLVNIYCDISSSFLNGQIVVDFQHSVWPLKFRHTFSYNCPVHCTNKMPATNSEPQLPISVIDTGPATSNNLSISAASSSSSACSFLETTTTTSNTITATSQNAKETSKPYRKKRPPKNTSNAIKPKIEIKMAPHKPRKSAPTEYITDEKDMIVYDVEDKPEPKKELILNLGDYTYKGEFVNKPNQRFIRYDFDNSIKKPY
ncbi:hypothetical protein TNCV_1364211 [Trichonephila clavipes]|uniref:Uncharacterized protein n=1 Tax=Trichonephila clavipes TaxID=2585209 RepID=A0A8X6RUT8_TRICX|nr:hypothetical protein TNCV_1364211 [Trichonephila clavipes]